MTMTQIPRLSDKYRPLFLGFLLLCFCFSAHGQTYSPSTCCTVSNKAYGAAQSVSTDGRSWFYDATNFVMRDYNGTTEVFSYLNLPKYRSGHFPIFVHTGGVLQGNGVWLGGATLVYWFKDSTGNANLVRWYTDSTGNPGGPFYAVANNLSEGNAGLIKGNLSLDLVNNTSDAQKNAATVSLTNHTIDANNNTLLNIPNSALTNTSIGLTASSAAGSDITVPTTPAALGSSLVINIPTGGPSSRGAISSTDWNTFNTKQSPITLTVAGTSGPATFVGTVLNIPQYTAGAACINCNADSLKSLPVDTSSNRDGYILAFDSTNHKWYLTPNAGSGSGITQLTGDVLAGPGSGSEPATLATVNSNVGTFGSASTVGQFTVNGKGLITAATPIAIQIAESQVTNLTSDLAAKLSTTLTSGNMFVGNGSNIATSVTPSGDWTTTNAGANTIGNNKVTYAKFQAASQQALLGATGASNYQEITLGSNLSMTGNVINTNDTAEAKVGNILLANTWASLTGYTQNGTSSFSVSGSNIVAASGGSIHDITQSLDYNYYTDLSRWKLSMMAQVTTKNAASSMGLGLRGVQVGGNFFNLLALVDVSTGATSGKLYLYSTGAVSDSSTNTISVSATDTLQIIVERDGYNVTASVRNVSTNSVVAQVKRDYFPAFGQAFVLPNVSKPAVYRCGGGFTIDSLNFSSNEVKYPALVVISNSKGFGYQATQFYKTFPNHINVNYGSVLFNGGSNEQIQDAINRIPELTSSLRPKQILIEDLERNDNAGDSSTNKTNYQTLVTTLQNAGITVYHGMLYETVFNDQFFDAFLQRTYPTTYIPTFWATKRCNGCRVADSVHLSDYGQFVTAGSILDANLISKFGRYHDNNGDSTIVRGSLTTSNNLIFGGTNNFVNSTANVTYIPANSGLCVNCSNGSYSLNVSNLGINANILGVNRETSLPVTLEDHIFGGSTHYSGLFINGATSAYIASPAATPQNLFIGIGTNTGGTSIADYQGNNIFSFTSPSGTHSLTRIFGGGVYNSGSNIANGNLVIAGSAGSGNAAASDVEIDLPTSGSSGSTAHTLTAAWWFKGNTFAFANKSAAAASAILDLTGTTTKGMLHPILTTTQQNAISSPATGLTIWNSDSLDLCVYTGAAWLKERTVGGSTNIYNTDGSLTANRSMSGAGFTLALGTSGSNLGGLSITGGKYNSIQGSQILGSASTINNAVTSASGTVSNFSAYAFLAPTITSTNASITYANPATLRIDNSPTMSTNSTASGHTYALDVAAGQSHFGVGAANISAFFDGGVIMNGGLNSNQSGVNIGGSTSLQASINLASASDPTGSPLTISGNMWYNGNNLYFVENSTGSGVKRDLLNGVHNYIHTIFTPTTGGTVSLVNNQYNIINPAGALLALTVNLPSSPANNDVVYIKFTQTISTVTYANGTVVDGITAPTAGGLTILTYDSGTTSWY